MLPAACASNHSSRGGHQPSAVNLTIGPFVVGLKLFDRIVNNP
jgi:hypothetical protein